MPVVYAVYANLRDPLARAVTITFVSLIGLSAIRESWRQLFESGTRLIIRPSRPVQWLNVMTAVHTVHQHVHIDGDHRLHPPIIATNVFSRGAVGWKMVLHHASPAPDTDNLHGSDSPHIVH